jgi:glycosyltransferase involved in cell wall biosynthesis
VRLGLLLPRYGEEALGGIENWLRSLCEHLVAERGWEVDVYTTCAASAETWADHYPPGSTELNGVRVHRYRATSGRDPRYLHMIPRLRADPGSVGEEWAGRYIRLVGPVCPEAVAAAASAQCHAVAVAPYLYWPAVEGVPVLGRRAVFHPAAHDEPELHLPPMRRVFGAAGGLAYNTFAERDLVELTFPVAHLPSEVVGIAVEGGRGDPVHARVRLGLDPGERYVLCVGKVERAKGCAVLADMWHLYRQRRPDAPRLVFVGPVHDRFEARDGVLLAGRQPEEVKWGALAGCEAVVVPSAQESFSLVVLEAWLAGQPVVVNSRCAPTVEHCLRSGGGLLFEGYGELEVALDVLLRDRGLARTMAGRGRKYAETAFAWPAVLDRYERLVATVVRRSEATRR